MAVVVVAWKRPNCRLGVFDVPARSHVLSAVADQISHLDRRRFQCFHSSVLLSFGEDLQVEVAGAWLMITRLRYPRIPQMDLVASHWCTASKASGRRCDFGLLWEVVLLFLIARRVTRSKVSLLLAGALDHALPGRVCLGLAFAYQGSQPPVR